MYNFGSVPVSKEFMTKSAEMDLDLSKQLEIQCPVKIIHGVQDKSVPFIQSLDGMQLISTDQVELIFQKSGDHQMGSTDGLELIKKTLDDLITNL